MKKLILILILASGLLGQGFNKWQGWGRWGVSMLGPNLVTNGDFHDFTFDYPYIGDNVENLNETTFDTFTKWTASGDFSHDAVALNVKYFFTLNQTSQLIQTALNRADAGTNSTKYRFKYLVNVTTAPDGDFALNLKWGSVTVPLNVTTGTHSVEFVSPSNASTSDLIIEATCTTATVGEFTLDTLGLNRVGMAAHWVFDSYYHAQEGTGKTILQDLTANAHDLTASAGFDYTNQMTGSNPAYKNGKAVRFDGVDDWSERDANAFRFQNVTFCAWVNISSLANDFPTIALIDGGYSSGWRLAYRRFDNRIFVQVNFGDTAPVTLLSNPSNDYYDKYHNVVFSYDGSDLKLYVDGVLHSTVTDGRSINYRTTVDYFRIGYAGGGLHYFNGYISEVAYFNRALSATEVQELYGKAKGWEWDGVGSLQNDNFRQVISGGGTLTQTVSGLDANKSYKERIRKNGVTTSQTIRGVTSQTYNLSDGTYEYVKLQKK